MKEVFTGPANGEPPDMYEDPKYYSSLEDWARRMAEALDDGTWIPPDDSLDT